MAYRNNISQRDVFGRQLPPADVGNDWERSGIPTSLTRARRSGKTKTSKPSLPTELYYKPSASNPKKESARSKRRLGMTCSSPTAVEWTAQYANLSALLDAAAHMHESTLDDAMAAARQRAHTQHSTSSREDALAVAAHAHRHALADAWGALQPRARV